MEDWFLCTFMDWNFQGVKYLPTLYKSNDTHHLISMYKSSFNRSDVKSYLFNKKNSLTLDDMKLENSFVVVGTSVTKYNLEEWENEGDNISILDYWKLCFSLEDFNTFKIEENLSEDYPIYFFKLEDDCFDEKMEKYESYCQEVENYLMRKIHLKGDIIITDPCYIIRAKHHGTIPITDDDWLTSDCGSNLELFGIENYLCRDTLYGDWSCTTYNTDTNKVIGEFCADSGQVAVFLLDEVLRYNPNFNYHITKPWTTTLIKDFDGDVCFEKLDNHTLIVKGVGNINFKTRQIGL